MEGVLFTQTAARFMALEQEASVSSSSSSSPAVFAKVDQQFQKFAAWSHLGILVEEHEKRKESRVVRRLEQRVAAKAEAVRQVSAGKRVGSEIRAGEAEKTDVATAQPGDDTRMEVDGSPLDVETQERAKREEQAKEDEETTVEICRQLQLYLQTFGPLELNLQASTCSIGQNLIGGYNAPIEAYYYSS
jgi:hypothetical protein